MHNHIILVQNTSTSLEWHNTKVRLIKITSATRLLSEASQHVATRFVPTSWLESCLYPPPTSLPPTKHPTAVVPRAIMRSKNKIVLQWCKLQGVIFPFSVYRLMPPRFKQVLYIAELSVLTLETTGSWRESTREWSGRECLTICREVEYMYASISA